MGESLLPIRAVARVLIMNEAGEVLLCHSRDGSFWVPPGGTVDPGETLAIAAVREAFEEAGLTVTLGPMVYLQEFRPKHRTEHVIEVAFLARTPADRPADMERVKPLGPSERPWAAWSISDLDGGTVREVRWFSREAMEALTVPVRPAYVKDRFWAESHATDPYLGLVQAR
jgi:ADP-ribose pyrophosphatase YjhB (NUDIX family)